MVVVGRTGDWKGWIGEKERETYSSRVTRLVNTALAAERRTADSNEVEDEQDILGRQRTDVRNLGRPGREISARIAAANLLGEVLLGEPPRAGGDQVPALGRWRPRRLMGAIGSQVGNAVAVVDGAPE